RSILSTGTLAALSPVLDRFGLPLPITPAAAQGSPEGGAERSWRHGISLFGDLKYPAGFKHFDYVNPSAPKGGTVRLAAYGTFDNFNLVIAGLKGTSAAGVGLVYDTLMVEAQDEVSTAYGQLAEAVAYPEDFSSAVYRLRPQARWHDGKSV